MNKQEAIKRIEQMGEYERFVDEPISKGSVLNIISQIHEPQQVVVPKFVGEWYERNKDDINTAIYSTITGTYRKVNGENDDLLDTFEGWLVYEDNSILILVQMHLFGYEVEQEQMYTVEIPDPNRKGTNRIYLGKSDPNGKVFIHRGKFNTKKNKNLWLTEEEIKQDFEWAWQWAKPVEDKNE